MYSRDEKYPSELHESREGAYRVIITISRSNIFHFHVWSYWLRNDMFIHLSLLGISSLLCICVTLPPLYNYMDSIVRFSKRDFDYCEVNFFSALANLWHTFVRKQRWTWKGISVSKWSTEAEEMRTALTIQQCFNRMPRFSKNVQVYYPFWGIRLWTSAHRL